MDLSVVLRTDYPDCGTFFNGMESEDDRIELFSYIARFNFCLWRRRGTWLAGCAAAWLIKENDISARRDRLRRNMGTVAFAALVHRRSPKSVNAVPGAGYARHIPLLLAGDNLRALKVSPPLHAFSRVRQRADVVVCIKAQFYSDCRHLADYGCGNRALADRYKNRP